MTTQPSAPDLGQAHDHIEPRQFRRSRHDHVVGGVCGGLGQYFGIDPLLPRLAFVALTLAGGSGVLLYIIAWIVIPEATPEQDVPTPVQWRPYASQAVVGGVVILAGFLLLIEQLVPGIGRYFWPLLLVVVGGAILVGGERR